MNTIDFGQWYYAMYVVPGIAALLFLALSAIGGRHGHGRHHGAGRVGPGHHGAARGGTASRSNAAANHNHTGGNRASSHKMGRSNASHASNGHDGPDPQGQDSSAKADVGATKAGNAGLQHRLAAVFGGGDVPVPFIASAALLGWALGGFWTTRMISATHLSQAVFVPAALLVAAFGSLVSARLMAAVGVRILPRSESYAVDQVDLCGLTAQSTYPIDSTRGRIQVYDVYGTLHDSQARIASGQDTIARGEQVLIVDYDAAHDLLIVEKMV